MEKKKLTGIIAAAVLAGAAGAEGVDAALAPEPLVLNVVTAFLRDGVGVVETVCAEAEPGAPGAVQECFVDPLPPEEAKAARARIKEKSIPRWKAHRK